MNSEPSAQSHHRSESMTVKTWIKTLFLLTCTTPLAFPCGGHGKMTCRLELDRKILPALPKQKAVLKVTLTAPRLKFSNRSPVNLAVVLDRSSSMRGEKIQYAKDGTLQALRQLNNGDAFSLVTYSSGVYTLVPSATNRDADAIANLIANISAGGSTALFGGVSQGAAEVRKHLASPFIHRVLLLSDGLANIGPSSPSELGRLGAALQKEGISVSTVGVGFDYNEDLMTHLSQASDGNTYFAESADMLPQIFAEELGGVFNVVAQKVDVTLSFPEGVRPLRIVGREGRIRGNTVEVPLNQLYAGQDKYALVEVEISDGRADQTREIARAQISYWDLGKNATVQANGRVEATFSKDEKTVLASTNQAVVQEHLLNEYAVKQLKATELYDQGKQKEALDLLKYENAYLRSKGEETKNEVLIKRAEQMETLAKELEQEGYSKKNRKWLKTDSLQIRSQQAPQIDRKKQSEKPSSEKSKKDSKRY